MDTARLEENVDEVERVEVFRLYSVGDSRRNILTFQRIERERDTYTKYKKII